MRPLSENRASRKSPRLAYLTLQSTNEGQAAHAHVHEITAGLRELGWEVDLYQPRYPEGRPPSALRRLMQFVAIQRRLIPRMKEYDAIYVRAHALAYPAALAARRLSKPVLQECNGPYSDLFAAWPLARALKRPLVAAQRHQYRLAVRNIAVTEGLRSWINKEARRNDTVTVANGANINLFRPGAQRPAGLPARYVVFFGALAPWQGLATLLSACSSSLWPQDIQLVVVGDGVMRNMVEAAAVKNSRVMYLGRKPYRTVPGIVANSLASISIQDDAGRAATGLSPLKVYESMASGVPTIVSEQPALAELIEESSAGIIVPTSDPHALARAVAMLARDSELAHRMGRAGRSTAVSQHSWGARASEVHRILAGSLPRE